MHRSPARNANDSQMRLNRGKASGRTPKEIGVGDHRNRGSASQRDRGGNPWPQQEERTLLERVRHRVHRQGAVPGAFDGRRPRPARRLTQGRCAGVCRGRGCAHVAHSRSARQSARLRTPQHPCQSARRRAVHDPRHHRDAAGQRQGLAHAPIRTSSNGWRRAVAPPCW